MAPAWTWLPLDDADRDETHDPPRQAGYLDDLDDPLDVFVGKGGLLGQASVRGAADDDPMCFELPAELRAPDPLAGTRAGHRAACAVTRGAEGALHRARLAGEHEARRAHAARDEDGLADGTEVGRNLGRPGREGSRCALAVDED